MIRLVLRLRVFVALLALLVTWAGSAEAQVVRGLVRSSSTALPIPSANIVARDSLGNVLASAVSAEDGSWALKVQSGGAFELRVRRLGFEMSTTNVRAKPVSDTLEFEFLLTEIATEADAVRITAESSLNERRLNEAIRRGWKVFEPELVAQHRNRAQTFNQLMRTVGSVSVILPQNEGGCIRTTRSPGCLSFVVDGQVLGPNAVIIPSDIYFFAILSPSESRVQYGDRAPFGAIAIYTRSRLDRQPRRPNGRP
ncbi:MAG: carboxypeptidase regulatory-like domain-containing protein [Gemmatimonadaceae bacterium]|nr:carboxypeptidase regulatory-like domain-containing protein [Gemmatimonadaceae bacterium]